MRRRAQTTHFKSQINGIILPESPKSPLSPIGRVAKRNAKLLNGLGAVSIRDAYSDAIVGTLPDLVPFDYEAECPTFSRLIDNDNKDDDLQLEELNSLQYEIEKILTNNIDRQKWIHGETTFLKTGDYPTVDLSDRLMPEYKLRGHIYHDEDAKPGCSKNFAHQDGMSDFGSSPDEDAHHRVSILDIPQRFWSWTREYLLKIDEPYVKNWLEVLVKKFDENHFKSSYVNEPFKYRKRSIKMEEMDIFEEKNLKSRMNSSYIHSVVSTPLPTKLRLKRRTSEDLNGHSVNKQLKLEISPINDRLSRKGDSKLTPLVVDMVDAYFMELKTTNNKFSLSPLSRQNAFLGHGNGINGCHNDKNINGFLHDKSETPTSLDRTIFDDLGEALVARLIEKNVLAEPSEYLVKSLAKEPLNEPKIVISKEGMKNYDDVDNLDEVSQELLAKQQELVQYEATTRALINCAIERIKGEYSMNIIGRQLDKSGNEAVQLANKFTSDSSFFAIPVLTVDQRERLQNALDKHNAVNRLYDRKAKPTIRIKNEK